MSKNPVKNALAAGLYIVFVSIVMDWGTRSAPKGYSILAPMAIISLFTLSAAVMGYLFCYQPIQLYFVGKKKLAVDLFVKTVAIFSLFTVLMLSLMFIRPF